MKFNKEYIMFIIFLYVLIFQNPLENFSIVFKFFDELIGILGFFIIIVDLILEKRKTIVCRLYAPIIIFSVIGLLGNIIYRYQPLYVVAIDFLTNIKFFTTIIFSFYFFRKLNIYRFQKKIFFHLKFITLCLFLLTILDEMFHIYGATIRYGIRAEQLFFSHCTYLAGSCMFLLALFMLFENKKCYIYQIMLALTAVSTLRTKAICGVIVFFLLHSFVKKKNYKLRLWQIFVIIVAAVYIGWNQFSYYYSGLHGASARSVLTLTSFIILKDYFPIGTGFGTYASHMAGVKYSPIYVKYGFEGVYELRRIDGFFDDTFWPIIIGQTGFIGLVIYLLLHYLLLKSILVVRKLNINMYKVVLFIYGYLLISSTSEPAFNNLVAFPLAIIIGIIFRYINDENNENKSLVVK